MFFFFQAEDGIRDLVRSRGLGDVYKRQHGVGFLERVGSQPGAQMADDEVVRSQVERIVLALSLIHI